MIMQVIIKNTKMMVFQILRYNKFYAKFSKCDFLMKDINFLSHIMYKKAVSVDPANI